MWLMLAILLTATTGEPYLAACGRSPIPQGNETFNTPIPYKRLQPENLPKPPPPGVAVPWTEADRFVGQRITVEGTIVDTHALDTITFLNFDKNWQGKFYVVVFASAHTDAFHPETEYLNKKLRITGVVSMHKDRPQLKVDRLDQIEILQK